MEKVSKPAQGNLPAATDSCFRAKKNAKIFQFREILEDMENRQRLKEKKMLLAARRLNLHYLEIFATCF